MPTTDGPMDPGYRGHLRQVGGEFVPSDMGHTNTFTSDEWDAKQEQDVKWSPGAWWAVAILSLVVLSALVVALVMGRQWAADAFYVVVILLACRAGYKKDWNQTTTWLLLLLLLAH